MNTENREVLEMYLAVAGYNEAEKRECINAVIDRVDRLKYPPELTYGTGIVLAEKGTIDIPEENIYRKAYYQLDTAIEQTEKAREDGYTAVTLVLLSSDLREGNALLAYTLVDTESNYIYNKEPFTSANYH